ncbi:MAG TPA: GNAT family N-acetyltransferase [Tepidisphaeraceae bacterium]|jgi:GNAT superfamily N-acetyltransferase
MPTLICDPPASGAKSHPFLQTLKLTEAGQVIAQARWMCATDPAQGVAQILDLSVSPPHQRVGHGHTLMEAITREATAYFKSRKVRLRRIWMPIEQKRQVIARSFLMQFGFSHVGTISELLRDEDLLIYMRTFD